MQRKPFRIHTWRLLLLAPVLAVLCTLMGVLPAFADTVTNTTEPINIDIYNPCNRELVTVSGEFHEVFHVTLDSSGGYHLSDHVNIHATGVGSLGNMYEVNITDTTEFNGKVGEEETSTVSLLFVSQGSAPNFTEYVEFHITVNPDGTVTSYYDNYRSTCQG